MEARDDSQLPRLRKKLANLKLLIIDALGFVPLSKTGATPRIRWPAAIEPSEPWPTNPWPSVPANAPSAPAVTS